MEIILSSIKTQNRFMIKVSSLFQITFLDDIMMKFNGDQTVMNTNERLN